MAALAMFPGIRFDPREPIPPRFAHLAHRFQDHQQVVFDDDDAAGFRYDGYRQRGVPWRDDGRAAPVNFARVNPYPQRRLDRDAAPEARRFEPEEPQLQQAFLAPLSASVKVQVVHDTAKFTVVHLFWNQSSHIKQGTYQFPLPLDATVTEYDCRIGPHKIVRGKVRRKEDARREFDDAVRHGRVGGLVEQQTAEIFTINLANIPANTKMRAELTFTCLLKHRISNSREIFTLTVPTFIAPRYGDVPQGVRMENAANHFLSLEVDVLTAEELITVNSDTHNILFERNAGQRACQTWDDFVMRRDEEAASRRTATIQLEQGRTSLDKDMVITITTALSDNKETPQACFEVHPDFEHHKVLMLTLPSDYLLAAANFAHVGEIVFVADRSGSMYDKIEALKSAMMFFINGIPENRPFNIWCFGSECTYLWPRSKPLNDNTRQEAINYVRNEFTANMGGTDILPALKRIYESRGGYHSMDIVVLTDGQVWEPQETIAFVKQTRQVREGLFRCFSLGIGHAVSHELVEGIAKAGGGYAEVITDARGGGWEDRVVAVLKAAVTGHLRSVQMELQWHTEEGHETVHPPKFKQSPADISTISPFIRNRVFLLFDSGQQCPELEAVVLNIREADGTITTKRVLPKRLLQPDAMIHKLAVRALLGDLERGESWLHQQNRDGAEGEALVLQEAVDLGIKWSLVSKWTSLYAVEEETDDAMPELHIEMQLPEINDEVGDALLLPRGNANENAGLLLGPGGAAVHEMDIDTESHGSDSEPASDDENVNARRGEDWDDDSDDGDDNHGPEGGAEAAGRRDDGAGDGGDVGGADGGGDGGSGGHGGDGGDGEDGRDWEVDDDGEGSQGTGRTGDFGSSGEPLELVEGVSDMTDNDASAAEPRGWESTASRERPLPVNPELFVWPSTSALHSRPRYPGGILARHASSAAPPLDKSTDTWSGKFKKRTSTPSLASASGLRRTFDSARATTPSAALASTPSFPAVPSSDPSAVLPRAASPMDIAMSAMPPRAASPMDIAMSAAEPSSMPNAPPSPTFGAQPAYGWRRAARRRGSRGSARSMSPAAPSSPSAQAPFELASSMQSSVAWPSSTDPYDVINTSSHIDLELSGQYLDPSSIATSRHSIHRDFELPRPIFDPYPVAPSAVATAPVYNPPASSYVMESSRSVPKTEEDLAAERIVRDLVGFQRSDGRFVMENERDIIELLGSPFLRLLAKLKAHLNALDGQKNRVQMVTTVAVVALLEEQFQRCRALWVLMVRKAKDFIAANGVLGAEAELLEAAKADLKKMGSVASETQRARDVAASVDNVLTAPVVA